MRTILVADDDQMFRESIRRILERQGYDVESVPDVDSALRSLGERHFDLVVCDYRMPGRSGIDLLKELNQQESRVPVMMVSALLDAATKELARELGAVEILDKPVRRQDLINGAAKVIGG